jgi:hypothetical protein
MEADDKRHETDDDFWAAAILEWSPGPTDDKTRNLRRTK